MNPFKAIARWYLRYSLRSRVDMERIRREVDEGAYQLGTTVHRPARDMVMYPRITGNLDEYLELHMSAIDRSWS